MPRQCLVVAVAALLLMLPAERPAAEPVTIRQVEGLVHGFLALRAPDGQMVANGDLIQKAVGGRVQTRLVFRFRDGSVHDERAVFSQRGHFRLISDHLVQHGPSFPRSIDMRIDAASGQVTVRSTDDHGEQKVETERLELPPDVSNGMMITLLKNVRHDALPDSVSLVAATPKPRLVKLKLSFAGFEKFSVAGSPRQAAHYVVKVDIGGVAGLIAPLLGKQPADSHVWILEGDAPAFVKSEAPFFLGGPVWRTDLVSPSWK